MNLYKSGSELKQIALEKMQGKFGISMLVSPVLDGALTLYVQCNGVNKAKYPHYEGTQEEAVFLTHSFLPLKFLCIFTLFVGFLWLIPYMNMTYALFFLVLMEPKQTVGNCHSNDSLVHVAVPFIRSLSFSF